MPARTALARRNLWLVIGTVGTLALGFGVLFLGQAPLPVNGVFVELIDRITPGSIDSGLTPVEKNIVAHIRLPRIVLGVIVGASLATAGATFQGVFRNPLADPYLLGVAAGGGFGATLAFVNDWGDGRGVLDGVQVAAFVGALASVALTWTLGGLGERRNQAATLLLAGVAVASFFTALQTYLQQRNPLNLREVYVWFLGGLTTEGWGEVLQALPVAVVCITVLVFAGRTLDVLALGDEEATMLGLSVVRARVILVVVAALLTAAAVAVSGLIAFVGLVVPHVVRLLFGVSYRIVVPMSIVAGASFLVLCDLGARTLQVTSEVPIGVVTAFFGAPFFVLILRTANR